MADSVETKISCEKPKVKPEISDTFNWSKEEREKLNEDILVTQLRQKLIEKYPEQKCFFESAVIRVMQQGKNIDEYNEIISIINTHIFLLYSQNEILLSYLDQNGNTIFDLVNFDFDNDLMNLLFKKQHNIFIMKNSKNGNLELFDNGKIYQEGSTEFNRFLIPFFPLGKYFNKK